MNIHIYQGIANALKYCIVNGDADFWSQLLMIRDDITLQSMYKWFEDYFIRHKVDNCEIIIDEAYNQMKNLEFKCLVKVDYKEYEGFVSSLLVKIGYKDEKYGITCIEQIYSQDKYSDLCWYTDIKEGPMWWEYSTIETEAEQNDIYSYKHLSRAITRSIRFREAHIQLECASLMTCMMSKVIPSICEQLNLPNENSGEKIKTLYDVVRNKFSLQIARDDRDNTWASKYLAPWYGLEEILANNDECERITVSCNAFMTILYSLLRWSGFKSSQLVQFRIINQDYLIIQSDNKTLHLISHDNYTLCNRKTIYPSGKVNRVFGADWFIDFKNNVAEVDHEILLGYNFIAENTFLPKCYLTGNEIRPSVLDVKLSHNDFRNNVMNAGNTVSSELFLWAKYANQTLYVPKPEAYIYCSTQGNWGTITFSDEKTIYEYVSHIKKQSIFTEDDRVMTANQCIRHQKGGSKDIAIFLYAALKKFLNAQGCVVFTNEYEYCIYRLCNEDEWKIFNTRLQEVKESIEGDILLIFDDTNSYYPLRYKGHTKHTCFKEIMDKVVI